MKCCLYLCSLFLAAILVLLLLPTPRDYPLSDTSPSPVVPLQSLGIPLNRFQNATFIKLPSRGPEDIIIDSKGFAYTGLMDGSLIKINIDTKSIEVLYKFNSSILGVSMSPSERYLAFANRDEGLVIYDLQERHWRSLAKGPQYSILNGVSYGPEDTIYFTVSSTFEMNASHQQLFYRTKLGKIYKHRISQQKTQIFAENIQYPNGIAYSQSENCLYVGQLNQHRVLQYKLDNPQPQTIYVNPSAVIDNFKLTEDGYLWIGTPTLRSQISNFLQKSSLFRKFMINLRLPDWLVYGLADYKYGGGIKLDVHSKKVVEYLYGESELVYFTTCIVERNGIILVGSLVGDHIGVLKRSELDRVKNISNDQL